METLLFLVLLLVLPLPLKEFRAFSTDELLVRCLVGDGDAEEILEFCWCCRGDDDDATSEVGDVRDELAVDDFLLRPKKFMSEGKKSRAGPENTLCGLQDTTHTPHKCGQSGFG